VNNSSAGLLVGRPWIHGRVNSLDLSGRVYRDRAKKVLDVAPGSTTSGEGMPAVQWVLRSGRLDSGHGLGNPRSSPTVGNELNASKPCCGESSGGQKTRRFSRDPSVSSTTGGEPHVGQDISTTSCSASKVSEAVSRFTHCSFRALLPACVDESYVGPPLKKPIGFEQKTAACGTSSFWQQGSGGSCVDGRRSVDSQMRSKGIRLASRHSPLSGGCGEA
jgi:hypothetical protein